MEKDGDTLFVVFIVALFALIVISDGTIPPTGWDVRDGEPRVPTIEVPQVSTERERTDRVASGTAATDYEIPTKTPTIERRLPNKEDFVMVNPIKQQITLPKPQCVKDADCKGGLACKKGMCKPKCTDSNANVAWPQSGLTPNTCTDKNGNTFGSTCKMIKEGGLLIDYTCDGNGDCVPKELACPCGGAGFLAMECETGKCVTCPGGDLACDKFNFCGTSLSVPPAPCAVGDKNCKGEPFYGECTTTSDCAAKNGCYFMNTDGIKRFGCVCDVFLKPPGDCVQTSWSKTNSGK